MPTIRPVAFLTCAALLMALAGCLPGCLGTRGPELPDLTLEHDQVDRRSLRLERIRQVMQEDLDEFEALRARFSEPSPQLYAPPFPLDLFKHIAMACLNEPWDPNQLETTDTSQDNSALKLSCSPEFGQRLLVELQEKVPERREQAIARLATIDTLRTLRGKLRQRLGRIPAILRASKSLLAARRAELRQTRASYARRRTEYSAERWQKLEDRLAALQQDLGRLEAQIERLEQVFPEWSPALDRSVSMLYMEVAKLSP